MLDYRSTARPLDRLINLRIDIQENESETRERRNLVAKACNHPRRQARFSLLLFVGGACQKESKESDVADASRCILYSIKLFLPRKEDEKGRKGARDFNIQRARFRARGARLP